ncbi:MAG: hypothetical protein KBA46_04225, partial [Candidatus Omnitrophica bacterium]|nr:hypothetical protein [Candidatus Omnitrophota bacterium]
MLRKIMISFLVLSMGGGLLLSDYLYATPSTHIWAPSTDVQAYGVMHITSDVYIPSERDAAGNRPDTITNLGLTSGILPFEKLNMEVGFDHKSGLGDLDDYPMYFNAKIGIPENSFGSFFPGLAVGMYDMGTKKNQTNYNVAYAKAAKSFAVKEFSLGRVSLGYFRGNAKLLLDGTGNKDNDGVFAAWERQVPEISDKLWVCAEYMGTDSTYGTWNFGASWKFSDNVAMIVGYDRYHNRDLADT